MSESQRSEPPRRDIAAWLASIGGLAIFVAALLYYLGRLYLTAYYNYYGISPGTLAFSTYDYMFSAIPIVFMVTGTIPGIILTYISLVNWWPFGIPTGLSGIKRGTTIFMDIVFQLFFALVIFNYFTRSIMINNPYLDGLTIGVAIGSFFSIIIWTTMMIFSDIQKPEMSSRVKTGYIFIIVLLFVYFLAIMPILSDRMAERVANLDANRLAHVTIVTQQPILELQSSKIISPNQIDARLIIINNDWIYFSSLISDNVSSQKDAMHNIGPIYSLRIADVERIIYHISSK